MSINLKQIINLRSLGNPELTKKIIKTVYHSSNPLKLSDLIIICKLSGYTFIDVVENNINILDQLGLLKINGEFVTIGKIEVKHNEVIYGDIIKLFLDEITNMGKLFDIFKPEGIFFDNKSQLIGIKQNYLSLKHSQIRDFLINFGFYSSNIDKYDYFIDKKYEDYFKNIVSLSKKKEIAKINKKNFTLEQLNRILDIRNEMGMEGEKIALEFELLRLVGHSLIQDIKIISDISVNRGYDIVSFDGPESKEIDRYIEVKSYRNQPRFFWSENEVRTAERLSEKYYIYLVNLSDNNHGNNIIIIKDPFKHVFESVNWKISTSTWEVNKINNKYIQQTNEF